MAESTVASALHMLKYRKDMNTQLIFRTGPIQLFIRLPRWIEESANEKLDALEKEIFVIGHNPEMVGAA